MARLDLDMTEGNIWKHMLQFSIPMAIGLLFQQLYNTVDTLVVGQFVGQEAQAAVGSTGPIINTIVGFCAGLATGASVVISQRYGAHDDEGLSKAVQELCRITRPGGCVIASVDGPDEEYESEPHTVNKDGDYLYTEGKWKGRVHHPYTPEELGEMTGKPYVMLEDPDDRKGQYTMVIRNWES